MRPPAAGASAAAGSTNALLTVTTALAIVVEDPSLTDAINSVRVLCDAAYPRWMPHVNLVYPFISEKMFKRFAPVMQEAMQTDKPFPVKLGELGAFGAGTGRESIHFTADEPQIAMLAQKARRILWRAETADVSFKGHLTVAQFPLPVLAVAHPAPANVPSPKYPKKLLSGNHLRSILTEHFKRVLPAKAVTVRELCLLARSGDEPFRIVQRVPIGVAAAAQTRRATHAPLRAMSPNDNAIVQSLVIPTATKLARQWILRMAGSGTLPKSLHGLRNAIAKGPCVVRVALDLDVLLAQMLAKGWVKRTTVSGFSTETVTVVPKAIAAQVSKKKKYTRCAKYILVTPDVASNHNVVKNQKKFRKLAEQPGIAIVRKSVPKDAPAAQTATTQSVFGNPEAFAFRIVAWLARMAVHRDSMSEVAFRRQLADCARVPTVAPVEEVVRMLVMEKAVAVSAAGVVTYDPRAAAA